jgi:fluoride ion exporter CrcB/FEX
MSQLAWVAFGGALGSALALALYQWAGSQWRVLAVNTAICAVMGMFAAAAPHSPALQALLGYGVLSTSVPLTSVLLPLPTIAQPTDAWRLLRRTGAALAINGVFCAAFAMAGYLGVQISVTLYDKLTRY